MCVSCPGVIVDLAVRVLHACLYLVRVIALSASQGTACNNCGFARCPGSGLSSECVTALLEDNACASYVDHVHFGRFTMSEIINRPSLNHIVACIAQLCSACHMQDYVRHVPLDSIV